MEKKKVFIFIAHYLPGYKMGGPVNSVININSYLKDYFDFYIITSDRDMGDDEAYKDIVVNEWCDCSGAKVMYLNPNNAFYWNLYKHLKDNQYDVIYTNSLFEFKFSVYIVLLKYFKLIKFNKIIVAPRGELFVEALKFGKLKKQIFLYIINTLGIYNKILWHSTANIETTTIINNIKSPEVKLARVLSNNERLISDLINVNFVSKDLNLLKIIFLSRISKEKNLIYALKVLNHVACNVEFHIYGPKEDVKIWKECEKEIKTLPKNIIVYYKGNVKKKDVKTIFSIFISYSSRELRTCN
jgi:glycosyltransferase involved in cell wall biosynthesis